MAVYGCDYAMYSTQAGEHVVYHWDAAAMWAHDGEQLCGGTAAAADQLIVAISEHYGWSLPEKGATIDYFWNGALARSSCSRSGAPACVLHDGTMVFTYEQFDTHELAHTARGGHANVPFIAEGLASRWQSGMVDFGPTYLTSASFFSEAQLRAQLELNDHQEVDYQRGMTWLVALETAFGPVKVGEFIDQLGWQPSLGDVERTLQQVLGISLAESVALAESVPEGTVDDPVCYFPNLPTWVLTEDPDDFVYVDRGEAHCGDDDLISISGQLATWLFEIELPESVISLDVEVTLPAGVKFERQMVTLATCNGKVDIESIPFMVFDPGYGNEEVLLHGRHVGALIGEIAADGSVELPRVLFRQIQPPWEIHSP
jgi:hypothetical protein